MEQNIEIPENKVLILDYSKWRCGVDSKNKLGQGVTKMKNKGDFTCCLGQFYPQLSDVITEQSLLGLGTPASVVSSIFKNKTVKDYKGDILVKFVENISMPWWDNSELASTAMNINDYSDTTPQQKIDLLKPLFLEAGYEIKVINQPVTQEQNKENTEIQNGHAEA